MDDETRQEIETVLAGTVHMDPRYCAFIIRWLAFNRAYNEMDLEMDLPDKGDRARVLAVGRDLQSRWDAFRALAAETVSMECVGGDRVTGRSILRPNKWVKSATLYLRQQLGSDGRLPLDLSSEQSLCTCANCRPEKRSLCAEVKADTWDKQEMAALLRIVYQVRCNLFHGDKCLWGADWQTNRDRTLIDLSCHVLDRILIMWLGSEPVRPRGDRRL